MPAHRLNKPYPQLKRNLFIVTYGRSGSTLLQRLIQTIPGCTLRGENFNAIEGIWQSFNRVRKTRATWGKTPQPDLSPWYGADEVRPLLYANAMIDAMIAHVLRPPQDARYFGFKEIRYITLDDRFPEMLHFMRAHFKDAFFIFNTRDAEDVKKSAWWKNKDPRPYPRDGRKDGSAFRRLSRRQSRPFRTSVLRGLLEGPQRPAPPVREAGRAFRRNPDAPDLVGETEALRKKPGTDPAFFSRSHLPCRVFQPAHGSPCH
ncbi:sulfotransferase [Paracoccus homiensis]|uniref:sulfotransferase n=1 Tax=Paracoccus homiensis TaxID=364199 RepID=UPI00398CD13B